MREHMGLYRGKRVDTCEWVEGYLVHITLSPIQDWWEITTGRYDAMGHMVSHKIDPDTLGECASMCDKNGKLIFEGDIADYLGEYGKIEYDWDDARFMVLFDGWCTDFSHLRGKDVEIIGNIHDNPELLEGAGEDAAD